MRNQKKRITTRSLAEAVNSLMKPILGCLYCKSIASMKLSNQDLTACKRREYVDRNLNISVDNEF